MPTLLYPLDLLLKRPIILELTSVSKDILFRP